MVISMTVGALLSYRVWISVNLDELFGGTVIVRGTDPLRIHSLLAAVVST